MNSRNLLQWAIVAGALIVPMPAWAQEEKPTREEKPAQKDPAQVFAELDKNSDGKLTADEISDGQKRFFEHLLRVAGKEKGSELTKEEFLKGFKADDLKVNAPVNPGGPGGGIRPPPVQLFQFWDRNRDGKLTLDEVPERQREGFKPIFDRLGKKELTRDEFVKAMEQFRGGGAAGGAMRDPEAYFKRLDTNNDGKVTLEEVPEPMRPQIERWFARLGKAKDGNLSLDEVKKIVAENQPREGRPGAPGGRQSVFFGKLDVNGDGKLSKEELQKAPALFDELDLNKDGFLDPAELFGVPGGPAAGAARGTEQAGEKVPEIKAGAESRPQAGNPPDAAAGEKASVRPGASSPARNAGRGLRAGLGQRLDADGDGRISRSEARGRLKQNFDTIDENGDGFLDRSEIQKALRQMADK